MIPMEDKKKYLESIEERVKTLESFSKDCIKMLETVDTESIFGPPSEAQSYIMAACSKMGMSDPILSVQFGAVLFSYMGIIMNEKDSNLRVKKMNTLSDLLLIAKSMSFLNENKTQFIKSMVASTNLILSTMIFDKEELLNKLKGTDISPLIDNSEIVFLALKELKKDVDSNK